VPAPELSADIIREVPDDEPATPPSPPTGVTGDEPKTDSPADLPFVDQPY
jgi:hypothetical protein